MKKKIRFVLIITALVNICILSKLRPMELLAEEWWNSRWDKHMGEWNYASSNIKYNPDYDVWKSTPENKPWGLDFEKNRNSICTANDGCRS